jgi:hypothetical protein
MPVVTVTVTAMLTVAVTGELTTYIEAQNTL